MDTKDRLFANLPDKLRPLFKSTKFESRGSIVIGPRGTGKTTFLLEKTRTEKLFYLSADSPVISSCGLWQLGSEIFKGDHAGVIFDEVHFAPDWSRDLKALYDAYPGKKIIASDSSSIILQKGMADLSRRFVKIFIPFLSFNDYLFLKEGISLPAIDILNPDRLRIQNLLDKWPLIQWFKEYLTGGIRPFFLEGKYPDRQLNIIEKSIFSDLPFFLPQTNENILRLGNAIIGMLATSSIPTINMESTCRDWNIGKETFYNLLSAMEALSLIRIVDYKKSSKSRTKGAKILLSDPSHYAVIGGANPVLRGNIRESYVALELEKRFGEVYASKNEKDGDFVSNKITFEVGGQSKKIKNSDYVIRDDIALPADKQIPLWTMGIR